VSWRQRAEAGVSGGGKEKGRSNSRRANSRIRSVMCVVPGRCARKWMMQGKSECRQTEGNTEHRTRENSWLKGSMGLSSKEGRPRGYFFTDHLSSPAG